MTVAHNILGPLATAHHAVMGRAADEEQFPIYLNLVFKAYSLKTTGNFALAYFALIVICVVERLLSLSIDFIRDKPGQPWRIFPRACIYYVVMLIRYVLMIAIMYVYIPMFCIVCLGLTLGQICVEVIRYSMMMRRLNRQLDHASTIESFAQIKNQMEESSPFSVEPTSHVKDGCC